MEAWDLASGAYAEQVSGEVRAVVGAELRPGNIWVNVELPRLIDNPNVTKITTVDRNRKTIKRKRVKTSASIKKASVSL
jgi:hypothetical protein